MGADAAIRQPAGAAATGAKAGRRVPVRTCVACRTSGGKRGLLRVVRLGAGEGSGTAVLDPTGKKSGRGAYVCPTAECVGQALKQKKLERSLKTTLSEEVADALRAAVIAATASAAVFSGFALSHVVTFGDAELIVGKGAIALRI